MNDMSCYLAWTPEFATGLDEVDIQHQRLVDILNKLLAHRRHPSHGQCIEGILDELQQYTEYHFATENDLMEHYPVSPTHRKAHLSAHKGFITHLASVARLLKESTELAADHLLSFLVRWLIHHITEMDAQMAWEIQGLSSHAGSAPAKDRQTYRSLVNAVNDLYESLGKRTLELLESNQKLAREIEQRQALEQRLIRSENRYRSLYQHAPVALREEDWSAVKQAFEVLKDRGVTDFQAYLADSPEEVERLASLIRLVDINDEGARQLGTASKELVQGALYRFMDRAALTGTEAELAAIASGDSFFESRESYQGLDGVQRHLATSLFVVPGREETLDSVIAASLDITGSHNAEQALRASEQRFRDLVNTTDGIVWEADAITFNFTFISDKAERLLGYSPSEWKQPGFWVEHLHPEDRDWAPLYCAKCTGQAEAHDFEYRFISRDGRTVWLHDIVTVVTEDGKPRWLRGIMVDVTARKQVEDALTKSRGRLQTIVDTALDAIIILDGDGRISDWNGQAECIFGYSKQEAIGLMLSDTIIPARYRERHCSALERFVKQGTGRVVNNRIETWAQHRDGREFPIELAVTSMKMGDSYAFCGFIRDITERKHAEEVIRNQANYDALTSLPNRRLFYDRLSHEIKRAQRNSSLLAILFIDIDRFKEVNDTLGHAAGDILLREMGRRIQGCVRRTDTTARLGGDEFTVLISDLADSMHVQPVAQDLIEALSEPFQVEGHGVHLSASIGIAIFPRDADNVEALVKCADHAMYAAKDNGRNNFRYFTSSMQQEAFRRMTLGNELRKALKSEQFEVHFQPIVSLAEGRIVKAEALLRWFHPVLGPVRPDEFIPLAEDLGIISEIGDWVFRESARWAKSWPVSAGQPIQVSVNKSPRQFIAGNTQETWVEYLRDIGLPANAVSIEITERLLLSDHQHVARKLNSFRDAGVQISLDDFGTGYSALSYLKKFPIDYLKLDQSFVRDIASNASSQAIANAIIAMAHKLELKVIAEGIEDGEQLEILLAAGCDYGQGYLFSRPIPPREFERLLTNGGRLSPGDQGAFSGSA